MPSAARYLPSTTSRSCAGKRQEQLISPLATLVGPGTHGDRRDEEQEQVRHVAVELIQVRKVVREEHILPERHARADEHKQGDEHVAGGVAEVTQEVPLEDRPDHMRAARPRLAGAGSEGARSLLVGLVSSVVTEVVLSFSKGRVLREHCPFPKNRGSGR